MSKQFSLSSNDFIQSLINAVFCAVIVAFAGIAGTPGFNVFSADWGSILGQMINMSIVVTIGTLAKKFGNDTQGTFMGGAR